MYWFDLLFPPAMLLVPLVLTLCFRTPPGAAVDAGRIRTLTLALGGSTAAAIALCLALFLFVSPLVARYGWVLFFPLMVPAMLLINAKNPYLSAHPPGQVVRAASLVSRRELVEVPRWFLGLAWGLWLAGMAAVLGRLIRPLEGMEWAMWLSALGMCGLSVLVPVFLGRVGRMLSEEPEPMDSSGSPELADAYARLRRFRLVGFCVCGVGMLVTFAGFGIAMSWMPVTVEMGVILGIAGGIAGTVGGIAGGVFGTLASLRRARITEMLHRIQTQGDTAAKAVQGRG
jgi:hypothetical protein